MKIDRKELPFRQGAIGIIVDNTNRFLVVQMQSYDENQWRFPGGGIDEGEKAEEALLRELEEELKSKDFEIIKRSNHIIEYDWPEEVILDRYKKKNELYKGQQQIQFLTKYTGNSDELDFDNVELRQVAWITLEEFPKYFVFPGQLEESLNVVKEFSDHLGFDSVQTS